ncbi:MAG: Imm8 family immunity protein [Burkholderiales bacterium]
MRIELKGIFSPELNAPHTLDDPECCAVFMYADIGTQGEPGADTFNFTVITPAFLAKNPEVRWGHGYLLMPAFSWREVERMVSRLVSGVSVENWEDAAKQLTRYMEWEFDNYQPYESANR